MESIDRVIRGLYALAVEEDWSKFRGQALEQACRAIGATAGAWLTQADDRPHDGESTVFPAARTPPTGLQTMRLSDDNVTVLDGSLMPGARRGVAMRYGHQDSRLVSRVAFWFSDDRVPPTDILLRLVGHLCEGSALALTHFILRDERLSRWGRANRGTAALVDAGGTVHAASRGFRELLGTEFGNTSFDRLPFDLPDDAPSGQASFARGHLRFRTTKTDGGVRFLLYARREQPLDGLSPREQEIARALSAGKTFKSVARLCGIATSTVANHASRIYRKLGIYRREELLELIRASDGSRARP